MTPIGTLTFAFNDVNNGIINFTINGQGGTKQISRAIFYTPPAVASASLTLLQPPDSFCFSNCTDTILPLPYSTNASASASVQCVGSGCASVYDVGTFKLKAVGGSYTITNLQVQNLTAGSSITPQFSGLSNGQTIAAGQTLTFKLQSPFTSGNTVTLKYFFTVLETGQNFSYIVQLRTN